jgi:hypothetical protein
MCGKKLCPIEAGFAGDSSEIETGGNADKQNCTEVLREAANPFCSVGRQNSVSLLASGWLVVEVARPTSPT